MLPSFAFVAHVRLGVARRGDRRVQGEVRRRRRAAGSGARDTDGQGGVGGVADDRDVRRTRAPFAVGLNVTLTVHEAPAAIAVPHVFVCANGAATEIDDTVALTVPVFLTVTVCAADVVPTVWLPNASDVGRGGRASHCRRHREPPKISNSDTCAARPAGVAGERQLQVLLVRAGRQREAHRVAGRGVERVAPSTARAWCSSCRSSSRAPTASRVRVAHDAGGGRSSVTEPRLCAEDSFGGQRLRVRGTVQALPVGAGVAVVRVRRREPGLRCCWPSSSRRARGSSSRWCRCRTA